jgi:succinate dehydrogenase/fumarate reductase flavoprotein subunit
MVSPKHTSRREFLVELGIAATGVAATAALSACTNDGTCSCGDEGNQPSGGASNQACTGATQTSSGGGSATGSSKASTLPGTGSSAQGGSQATGSSAQGGSSQATGSSAQGGSQATGGSSAQGGSQATGSSAQGGSSQATGSSAQGGSQATGNSASCPAPTQCATPATLPSQWTREVDVVVLGTGFAGLATAIAATDAGAKVLVLEKMSKSEEGGNSIISGNMWWTPTSVDEGVKYIKALCMGLTDDTWIQTLAQEMTGLNQWLATVGITASALGVFQPEHPELPGSSSVRTWSNNSGLWQPLRDAVNSRHVEVLYSTPAVDLIQDPSTREVKGVLARSGGQDMYIKSKRGVVLACGGFEFAYDMQAQFLPAWPVYCQGSPGNTGDGIKMAEKVGAALWHMNNSLAHVGCFVRDTSDPKSIPIPVTVPSGAILVDKFGSRFMNEKREERHGFGHKEYLFFFDGLKQCFSRIPCYLVFDETARKAGKLAGGLLGWYGKFGNYTWSSDNSAELASGWIKQGQTLSALATAIGADADTLSATVTRYNGFCTAGADQDFGRSASTLKSLGTAPYYAIPIYPLMYNTQGGPRRNEKCQVLTPSGDAIPRLYSAGELGSAWGWMYNGGGNASESVITGRIAGKNSAGEGPWA